MKNLLISLVALFLPLSVFAWVPPMQFQVNQNQVQVQVFNTTPFPAFCQGFVYGQTQTGLVLNSWFQTWIPVATFGYAYVYATPPYFFVNAWADIRCQQ